MSLLRPGLFLLSLLAPAVHAQAAATTSLPAATCQVAVMDLEAQGIGADQQHITTALTEALASSVAEHSGCEVITRADIESMMGFEAARMACGVDTDSCLAEIGNALGVQRIVAGSVSKVGDAVTISARLLNMERGKVDARAEESSSNANALRPMARRVGAKLFGRTASSTSSGPGPLAVVGAVVGSVGVVGLVAGVAMLVPVESTLGDETTSTKQKDDARGLGTIGLVVGGVGAAAVVVGVALFVTGWME